MTDIRSVERQSVISTNPIAFTFEDLVTAVAKAAADVPPGSIIVGGMVIVDTAWDTTGAATVDVGDASVSDRYASAVDLKTPGLTALSLTGYTHANIDTIALLASLAANDATAGEGRLILQYITDGRATENV